MNREEGVILMKMIRVIKDRFRSISLTWVRFPVLFLLLTAIAVLLTISTETGSSYTKEILALVLAVFLSAVMTTGFERLAKRRWLVFPAQAVALGLAALYYFTVLPGFRDSPADYLRVVILSAALLMTFLWIPCFRWKISFNDLFMSFVKAFFTTMFFIGIFFAGIMAILSAIDALLVRLPTTFMSHTSVWIWVFIAPMLFLSLIPFFGKPTAEGEEDRHYRIPGFFKVLLSYVLIPLTVLYTLVLVAYLIKTITAGDQMDLLRPMILAYCIAVILLYVLVSGSDNKISLLFRLILPKLMVLIALYQVTVLLFKVPDEGLVYSRYFIILFGIFSIAAGILMTLLPLKKNVILAVVFTGFALFSVMPPVDAFTYSSQSQAAIVEQVLSDNAMRKDGAILPNAGLSDNDRARLTAGMEYLSEMKETDRIQGVPENFEFYRDFYSLFGFSPYYGQTTDAEAVMGLYYNLDTSKSIEIDSYQSMVSIFASTYDKNMSEAIQAGVAGNGQTYDLSVKVNGSNMDLELSDGSGAVVLTASLSEMIDKIAASGLPGEKGLVPPEDMTFDVNGSDVSMRVIFQNATREKSDSTANYDASMMVLLRFNA